MNASTMTLAVASALLAIVDDWKIVVAALHYSSETALPARTQVSVRELGDGFGSLRGPKTEAVLDMLWDWSHVRDSSPEAVAKMAGMIRRLAHETLRANVQSDPRVAEWRRVAVDLARLGDFEGSKRCELEARKLEASL
jgi:hypothetical protein